MYGILHKKLRYIYNEEEIECLANEILFDSLRLFKNIGYNFSTYLSKSCSNKSWDILNRHMCRADREKKHYQEIEDDKDAISIIELNDILDQLKKKSPILHDVLVDKYLNCMTNVEIGNKNGYCSENARKKIQKALKLCQKMVYD